MYRGYGSKPKAKEREREAISSYIKQWKASHTQEGYTGGKSAQYMSLFRCRPSSRGQRLAARFGGHLKQPGCSRRMPDTATKDQNPGQKEETSSLVGRGKRDWNEIEQGRDTKTDLHTSKSNDAMHAFPSSWGK